MSISLPLARRLERLGRANQSAVAVGRRMWCGEDATYATCVMHHVPRARWRLFASELGRVTRPGGTVLTFEHNPYNPLTRRPSPIAPLIAVRCSSPRLGPRNTRWKPACRTSVVVIFWRYHRSVDCREPSMTPWAGCRLGRSIMCSEDASEYSGEVRQIATPVSDAIGLFNTLAYFVLAEVLHTVWETWNDRLVGNAEPARSISARPHPMSRPARLKQERLVDLRARSARSDALPTVAGRGVQCQQAQTDQNRLLPTSLCATVQKAEDPELR